MKNIDIYCDNIIAAAEFIKNYKSLGNIPFDRSLNTSLVRVISYNNKFISDFFANNLEQRSETVPQTTEKTLSPIPFSQPQQPEITPLVDIITTPDIKNNQVIHLNPGEEFDKILGLFDKVLSPAVIAEYQKCFAGYQGINNKHNFVNTITCQLKDDFCLKSENFSSLIAYIKNDEHKLILKYFDSPIKVFDAVNKSSNISLLYFIFFYFKGLKKLFTNNISDKKELGYLNLVIELSYLSVVLIINSLRNSFSGIATGHTNLSINLNSPNFLAYHLRILQRFVVEKFVSEHSNFKTIQFPSIEPHTVTVSTFTNNQKPSAYDGAPAKFIPNPGWEEIENFNGYNISTFLNVGLTDSTYVLNKVKFPLFAIIEKK